MKWSDSVDCQEKLIPPIALGTWSWGTGTAGGDEVFGNHYDETALKPVFEAAMREGLNLWDTAAVYGMGDSERILGKLIHYDSDNKAILSTKFTPQIAELCKDPVAKMLGNSLQRLGTKYVDIYWIHNPSDIERWTPYFIPLAESGKIKRVGVSNHNLEQIKRVEDILSKHNIAVSAVQNHFSLLYRSSEKAGIGDYCKTNHIDFFSYMVLEQGALTGNYSLKHPFPEGSQRAKTYQPILPQLSRLIDAMEQIGNNHQCSVAQIAIAWALAKGTIPIIGVTKVSHVTDAKHAASIVLSEEEIKMLEELADQAKVNTKGDWENPMV